MQGPLFVRYAMVTTGGGLLSGRLDRQQEYLLIKHMEKEEADHVRWVRDMYDMLWSHASSSP